MEDKIFSIAKKYALKNAVEHGGRAMVNPVVAKVLGEAPELRARIRDVVRIVGEVVEEVNMLSPEEQQRMLREVAPELLERPKEERRELPPLPGAEAGKVVTAFPPEPSKFPHLGHAKAALLNFLYARRYDGRFILRFEDSNPRMVRGVYYDAFREGLRWLGMEWDVEDYLSDHMEEYYGATERLIAEGRAYVCTCLVERVRELRRLMRECEHRRQSAAVNLALWEDMVGGRIREGEGNVRLKIDMRHRNAAMRDPAIMRPLHGSHPRVGDRYRVWPLYDFGTALLDAWEGVTHRIRSKEFEMRTELQNFIREACGFRKHPHIMEIARFAIEGAITSGRRIREMMSRGELTGWDDPRLVTLASLRRRGFLPEAVREFLVETGVSKAESTVAWSVLESINRRHIDPIANRYFAVLEPVRISVRGAPPIKEATAPLHPEFPERGRRRIPVDTNVIYVERGDFEAYRGEVVRLKDLFNVRLDRESTYAGNEIVKKIPKIHWVSEPNVKVRIVMPDASMLEAAAEPSVRCVKVDDVVQFERVGFLRVDKISPLTFYYAHK